MRKKVRKKAVRKALKIKPVIKLDNKAKVGKILKENKIPFVEGYFVLGNYYPDFINTERKLVIEIFNPKRSENERWQRIKTFYKHGYRLFFLSEQDFRRVDWEKYITGSIRGFISQ